MVWYLVRVLRSRFVLCCPDRSLSEQEACFVNPVCRSTRNNRCLLGNKSCHPVLFRTNYECIVSSYKREVSFWCQSLCPIIHILSDLPRAAPTWLGCDIVVYVCSRRKRSLHCNYDKNIRCRSQQQLKAVLLCTIYCAVD